METIRVTAPGKRTAEPVYFEIPRAVSAPLWSARQVDGSMTTCQRLEEGSTDTSTRFVAVLSFENEATLELVGPATGSLSGIEVLPTIEADGAFRLDTGYLFLEMCRGTGEGRGESKWGLRHFGRSADGRDLLPSGNNAMGGFYGPFFTPENGLINPPEHCVVDIVPIEVGPVLHRYRMVGIVPDGLLAELHGKRFSIDWTFTAGSDFFTRHYQVDDFQTIINGRSITNKITVGDEFESGQGSVTFDRFDADQGLVYREGDPYAKLLAEAIDNTVAEEGQEGLALFKQALGEGMASAHWDLYWKLFCAHEDYLPVDSLTSRLASLRSKAHRLADLPSRAWVLSSQAVNVSAVDDETIFAGPARRTAEYDRASGRCMVWVTSQPSDAFQIVQRPQSGWVNWGTNAENECPGLPTGTDIKCAFGDFGEDWRDRAAALAASPSASVSTFN